MLRILFIKILGIFNVVIHHQAYESLLASVNLLDVSGLSVLSLLIFPPSFSFVFVSLYYHKPPDSTSLEPVPF